MILERPRHEAHAVGEQRGGERIPCKAEVILAVEAKAQGLRAVDGAAGGEPERLHGAVAHP